MNTSARYPKRCLAFAITSLLMASAQADNVAVTVNVDANAGKHPISPYIYGVAFATTAQLSDLNAPINRYGGNTSSTYNWKINASNHASDWYFESIPEATATAGGLGDSFITTSKAGGAQAMLTIPMLDYVANLGANRSYLWSFSQKKYGTQTGNDSQYNPDAGNGVLSSTNKPVTYTVSTNPLDANVAGGVSFQQPWVQHLISTWGLAAKGGLQYYILDNEHSIWQGTHQDTHPIGPKMTEISGKMISYSNMIKALDPGAVVIGPEEWGWSGYFWSGYDQQEYAKGLAGCPPTCPDKTANGGLDYMPWLLKTLRAYDVANGTHILDVFSLHYYPQGDANGDQEYSNDNSTTTQLLRNKSTRSLWDPNYVDASWESETGNGNVELIPRMLNWVKTYYPGLKTGITEYNWGDEPYVNGATTQADIYGIFGREALDYATRWTVPDSTTPTYLAMKMYRNYDGKKSTFGDNSVSAAVPTPGSTTYPDDSNNLSAFAATRSADGALTVMVISKVLSGSTPVTVNIANFAAGTSAQAWQLTSANAISQLANVAVGSGKITTSVPAQSITLFVVPSSTAHVPPNAVITANPTDGAMPLTVHFSSTGSTGTIVSYLWNFGDGVTGTIASPAHKYVAAGNYVTTLTVKDNLKESATSNAITIAVNNGTGAIAAPSKTAAAVSGSTVTVSWQDNSDNEQGFCVSRALSATTPAWAQLGCVQQNVTSYVNAGVSAGTYLYRVRAYSETGGAHFSPFSPTAKAVVQ
jgi:PKD repeat protein